VLDTTLDDENASQHVTSILVMALCNQPEAFASDLGKIQSRDLFDKLYRITQSSSVHRTESVSVMGHD